MAATNGHAKGKPSVLIVGAGVGGTASAARLAQSGFDVTGASCPSSAAIGARTGD